MTAQPEPAGSLREAERFAANAILDRSYADPDDDAAIVARAALRLAALAEPRAEGLDVERLARAIGDHGDICSRMAIPE